jgi:hypothetical protein
MAIHIGVDISNPKYGVARFDETLEKARVELYPLQLTPVTNKHQRSWRGRQSRY